MSFITIKNLSKSYLDLRDSSKQRIDVLKDFGLSVKRHEFVTFFGPNACGKTTLLNCITDLTSIDSGTIFIDSKPPSQMRIGYVFQNFQISFFPWKKNIDNIAFPLELQGIKKQVRRDRVEALLASLDIDLPLHGYPYQLSGGQQQLLAIARAVVFKPQLLLLDEPFNQLDYQTRIAMQEKLLNIWRKIRTTILFVSHDLDEAILLGDKIFFLSKRPAKILEIMENDLPRPRDYSLVTTQEFVSLKNRGLLIFKKALKA